MTTDRYNNKKIEEMFQPGEFVMLHTDSQWHDAGRIGKIISRNCGNMLVEFFSDEAIGKTEFSVVPFGHWLPVAKFLIEEYEEIEKKRGWRLSKKGIELFVRMGWKYNDATEGKRRGALIRSEYDFR